MLDNKFSDSICESIASKHRWKARGWTNGQTWRIFYLVFTSLL